MPIGMRKVKYDGPRPNPYSQGSLQRIADLFVKPLCVSKGKVEDIVEFLQWLFDINNRILIRSKVKREFSVPGVLKENGCIPIQGIGERRVKYNQVVWIRHDHRRPNVYEVETATGVGNKTQVFQLTAQEFRYVKQFIYINQADEEKLK